MVAACSLMACSGRKVQPEDKAARAAFVSDHYDLSEIEESGEIIAATMYGRNTYYEYHGRETGTAYDLLSNFAQTAGIGVRVETAADTAAMMRMLDSGEADIVLYPIPAGIAKKSGAKICGPRSGSGANAAGWAVRSDQPDLAAAISQWYKPGIKKSIGKQERARFGSSGIRRHVRAPYVSRSKGIISQYDADFVRGSRYVGWDWRLIAAQCYQESGFDPNALSWAGAAGLMQIIPSTARHLGIRNVYDPQENIEAACRYLRQLQGEFSDVRGRIDRIRFTLAAYNGGPKHVRDAMNLARKYGKRADSYSDVSYFIRNLDKPKYYSDPVVKYGYMVGSETYEYVESILARWEKYRGGKAVAAISDDFTAPSPTKAAKRRNRFTRGGQEIIDLRDSL